MIIVQSHLTQRIKKQHERGAHGDGWKIMREELMEMGPMWAKVSVARQIAFTQKRY